MRKAWGLGAIAALVCAIATIGCGGSGGGPGNRCCGPDGGPVPNDGGCTGASCPTDGGPGTDGGPSAVPLTATPDRVVIGTTPGASKSEQVTLQNTSASAVSLQSLSISGDGAGAFQVSGGGTLPANLGPGASTTLTVTFNGAAGVSKAMLSAVTPAGTTQVPLGGMGLAAGTEPSLQWIFDVHNIPVNAGNPDPSKRDLPPVPIAGDETGIQSFVKAGDGPVTLQLLGSYGPTFEPVSINGWYTSGNGSARNNLFTIPQAEAFALDPTPESGTLSFDPGTTPFGFWSEWPFWEQQGKYVIYQEDRLNTWDTGNGGVQHHMRVYPYRNPDGTQDPHAYVLTTEEAPISAGPDYNDIVYVIRNVVPASGGGGALLLQNLDTFPAVDFAVFSNITTISNCYTPLSVKDSGVVRVSNMSGAVVTVNSVGSTAEFMVNPSVALPANLAP